MALKKDKQKVLGENFDDDRVKSFLIAEPREGESLDYMLLERAYRGMKADNFATFVKFFTQANKDINAQNKEGETFLSSIQDQRLAGDYIASLKNAGAK